MIRKALPLTIGILALAQVGYAVDKDVQRTQPGLSPSAAAPNTNWSFGTGTPFTDDFESYPVGEICGMGGWEEWSGSSGVCGLVTTEQANSGTKSFKIIGNSGAFGDDTVHQFDIRNGNAWTFSIMTFVPQNATGEAFIILLNQYPAFDWSLQVHLNADTNLVVADFNIGQTALIKGRWVEFRAEIDLPNDQVDYFYDGVEFVSDTTWRDGVNPGGQPWISALDLYAGEPSSGGTSGTYFDDVSLVLAGGCEPCDTNCDGTVDAFDIEPFIGILTGSIPNPCSACAGDADGSGTVDAFDIEPFINCLTGP